jgi:hypothetical protein
MTTASSVVVVEGEEVVVVVVEVSDLLQAKLIKTIKGMKKLNLFKFIGFFLLDLLNTKRFNI